MKKLLFIILFSFSFAPANANCDTIDFWHVYKNGIKIKEFNHYIKDTLFITDLKETDIIEVRHYDDTPCPDCPFTLSIATSEKTNSPAIIADTKMGDSTPLRISGKELKKLMKNGNSDLLYFWYSFENPNWENDKGFEMLFILKLR